MNYAALTPIAANTPSNEQKPQATLVKMDVLDALETAGTVTKELHFPVTCAIKQGQAIFFAQLKGGKRFSCTPVMPKATDGSILAPPNGEQGYLTIELSENANLQETAGKYEFSVRPVFLDFESVKAREARTAAPTAKPAAK